MNQVSLYHWKWGNLDGDDQDRYHKWMHVETIEDHLEVGNEDTTCYS